MIRAAFLAISCSLAASQAPTWFGFRPTASRPGSVDLVELTDKAVVTNVIGSVVFGNRNEYAWPNAVRCLPGPPAFCLLATTVADEASSTGNTSYVYSVSSTDAKIIYRTECPGVCNQMHVDFSSGTAYTFSFEGPGGSRAEVVSVTAAGAVQVADITAAVAGGNVRPGQTTHCSATKHMYVGVDHGGAGKDQVLAVDLTKGAVDQTVTLQVPLFAALWATCDGSGIVGGVSFETSAAGEATFGTVDPKGAFTLKSKVLVTPGLVPSGLLTATSPQDTATDAFFAGFYPPRTRTNQTGVKGETWSVDPYGKGTDDFTSPIDFYLIGAAWTRAG